MNINVKKNGVAEFNGFMRDAEEIEKLEEVIKEINGISDVKVDVKILTQSYSI